MTKLKILVLSITLLVLLAQLAREALSIPPLQAWLNAELNAMTPPSVAPPAPPTSPATRNYPAPTLATQADSFPNPGARPTPPARPVGGSSIFQQK